jgi:superfamily II DNA or RNA helicase
MMFIDIGKSFIRVIQTIGRGLRKAKDKDSVLVTDICSDLKYGKRHLAERTKFYREAQYPYKKIKVKYSNADT